MSVKDKRRLTGYRGDNLNDSESVYEDYQHDDVYEEYDGDSDDQVEILEQEEDIGSELSVPDDDINFDLVYALHTFTATVEGQASVVRGDALTLLDDSNSYWWLVKVLKTAEVGYIPAENIETPYERLARLNSHRNIEITRKDNFDVFPVPPTNKPKLRKKVTLDKGVQYQSQFIYVSSDEDDDDEDDDRFESEFRHWNEKMCSSDSNSQTSTSSSEEEYVDGDEDSLDDPYEYYNDQISYTDNNKLEEEATVESHISADSDIINDPKDFMYYEQEETGPERPREDEEETIKISLTPLIARDGHDSNKRNSDDTSLQTKLKKAAKLENVLNVPLAEKKEKKTSGIRKFFSRKKNKKEGDGSSLERGLSTSNDTLSINSSQSSLVRDRLGSVDSSPGVKHLKVQAGNPQMQFKEAWVDVPPTMTAAELVHQVLSKDDSLLNVTDTSYRDYYLVVKTLSGDECTLIPSDKPLEIFHSLTDHLNTPMPSLKKARRISQLMGSDNHVGGPSKDCPDRDEVEFFLFSKTKRTEDGEFQIKVSLLPGDQLDDRNLKRVDKLVKIPCSILIKDAVTLLLEKFHILNGVVADDVIKEEAKKSLRLVDQTDDDIGTYRLAIRMNEQERMLPLEEKLLTVFGDNIPPIHYRRNSNPDRTSITANTTTPEEDETYFILRCIEKPKRVSRPSTPVRQDTPMPRKGSMPTDGFGAVTHERESQLEDSYSHSSEQTITPRRIRPTSNESMLFCTNDFGMNDLMVIIRGAASQQPSQTSVRTEIGDLFKDSQARIEQLEKELDRIMLEAIKIYN